MKVKLVRKDHKDPEPESVILNAGKHNLGRAPPLNCADPNISRKHCSLEVYSDGRAELTSTHINHSFYFRPTSFCKTILKKGENVILNNGDLISFLPDSFLYYVNFITDDNEESNDSGNTSKTDSKDTSDMEAETQVVSNEDQERDISTNVQTDEKTNPEHEGETTLNVSDAELVSFDGFDDAVEEEEDINVPSPSLLDEATPSVPENKTSDKRELSEADAESSPSQNAKRRRPNSPEDVKPDISELQALVSTKPATSSINEKSQDAVAPVKVKTEAEDGAAAVKVKDEADDSTDGVKPAVAGESDDKAKPAINRTKCSFGASCYRKNPQHRDEYSHPGDPEWATPTPCQWGAACYRQNPQHRSIFSHPGPPAPRPAPQAAQGKKKPARNTRKKRPSWSGSESTDEYDTEDPFVAADSSDEYNPSSDSWSSGQSDDDTKGDDGDSPKTKRENRRLLREAKKFTAKK